MEGAQGGSASRVKAMGDVLGRAESPSSNTDKFRTTRLPKEKKGKICV